MHTHTHIYIYIYIGELIGTGNFGRVFIGFDEDAGSMMAVKEVSLDLESNEKTEEIAELQEEIDILSSLQHENIVQYLDTNWDKANNILYIFTEWVPGGSIKSIIEKFGALSENAIRKYTQQILLGLVFLHDNNVAHMDIKVFNYIIFHIVKEKKALYLSNMVL